MRSGIKTIFFSLVGLLLPVLTKAITVIEETPALQTVEPAPSDGSLSLLEIISLIFFSLSGVCLVTMVAATYIWITANRNSDQVDRARKIWHVAFITLAIVLFFWILITYLYLLIRGLQQS